MKGPPRCGERTGWGWAVRPLTCGGDLLEDVVHGEPLLAQGPALHQAACRAGRTQEHLRRGRVRPGTGLLSVPPDPGTAQACVLQ